MQKRFKSLIFRQIKMSPYSHFTFIAPFLGKNFNFNPKTMNQIFNIQKLSPLTRLIVKANLYWTILVVLSLSIYLSSSPDNLEAAGFLLIFASLPSSMLLALFPTSLPDLTQIILVILLGYLQWNLIAFVLGMKLTKKRKSSNH